MEWWQTLLIALCPSILSTIVAIVIPVTQMVNAKKERLAKYDSDKKQHISRKRLDMEFEIYKELSEKIVTLGVNSLSLFDKSFDYSSIGKKIPVDNDFKSQNMVTNLLNDANESIYKYAVFIPAEWYEKFDQIKKLCREQLCAFEDYVILGKIDDKDIEAIKTECEQRNKDISDVFDELVSELRKYIAGLDNTGSKVKEAAKKTSK